MSSRKLRAAAALAIAVALAGCGASGGSANRAVDTSPGLSPVAAASSDPYGSPSPVDAAAGGTDPYASSSTGGDAAGNTYGAQAGAASGAEQGRVATKLVATRNAKAGDVVADERGFLIYRFEKDTPKPPKSNCNGACATTWPPVLVTETPELDGISAELVGKIQRADGSWQATLNGWPLYYYSKDAAAGSWKGQRVGGTWFLVTKGGAKNTVAAAKGSSGSYGSYGSSSGSSTYGSGSSKSAEYGRRATKLVAAEHPALGDVVTDGNGFLLYRFEKDTPKPSKSNCTGKCAMTWPPVLVTSTPQLEGVSAKLVGKIKRADGNWQVTLNGWPLYYYNQDYKAGNWNGQGVGGTWFVSTKDGKKNTNCLEQAAANREALARRTASKLIAANHPQLGDVVTDQNGFLLYRFDKDVPKSSKSSCTGKCEETWPPVLVTSTPQLEGVSAKLVGKIRRADGSWQVTLNGWPLYHYSKDYKAGNWNGQGVGGTWFVSTKDGKKNTNCLEQAAANRGEEMSSGYGGGNYSSGGGNYSSGGGNYSSGGGNYNAGSDAYNSKY